MGIEGMDTEIEQAIAYFKKGGISEMIAGAKLIGEVIEQASGDISQCEEMSDDWDRLVKWSKIFKNPAELANVVMMNVLANRTGIAADIAEIKTDEASGNAKDLGLTIADLLVKLVGEVPALPSPVSLSPYL